MDVADYVLGCLALGLGLLPWVVAARRLARRLVPEWRGAEHAMAASILGIAGVVVVTELVGICDGLRRWPWAVVSAVVALGVAARGQGASGPKQRTFGLPTERGAQVMLGCVALCVVATSASLLGRDAAVIRSGPLDADSLHYHLTQAAQMVQAHNIDHLHQTASSDPSAYYPFDSELLVAAGMLGPHPDLAVFGLNLVFGWLALLACWVIGARWSRGAPAVAAGAAVLALPIVSRASSGPGLNDIPSMAFLLSAIAVLAIVGLPREDRPRPRWTAELCVAGAALGLAAGTKLPLLPIAVVLALGVVVLARGDRWVSVAALAGPALLTGGFWYVRDWVEVGSPTPELNLTVAGHGLHGVPFPEIHSVSFSVTHYVGNAHVIRHWFVPGLHAVWTALWPLVVLVAVAGVIAAVADRSRLRALLGAACVVGLLSYLVTPISAQGPEGTPILFASNTRYLLVTVIVAFVLLASSPRLQRFGTWLTVGFTALTLVVLAVSPRLQPINFRDGIAAAVILGLAIAGTASVRRRRSLGVALLVSAIAAVTVVGAGAAAQHKYVNSKYLGAGDEGQLFSLFSGLHHVRVGVSGFGLGYPLYGEDLDNTVNYLGVTAPDHSFNGPTTCSGLFGLLNRLHEDYVVVEPLPTEHTDSIESWLEAIPGVTTVLRNSFGTVYLLPSAIPATCST